MVATHEFGQILRHKEEEALVRGLSHLLSNCYTALLSTVMKMVEGI